MPRARRYSPRRAVVRKKLIGIIDQRVSEGSHALPSLADLAAAVGASYQTVQRAMQALQQDGIVRVEPRRGIRILRTVAPEKIPRVPSEALSTPSPPRWRQIRTALLHRLVARTYPPDALLPQAKQLCHEFGASAEVVGKALRSLAAENRLVRHGRGYRVAQAHAPRSGGAIACLACVSDTTGLARMSPHGAELWRGFERECRNRNLHIVPVPFAALYAPTVSQADVDKLVCHTEKHATIVGYILLTPTPTAELLRMVTRAVAGTRKPLTVIDESQRAPAVLPLLHQRTARLIPLGSTPRPGNAVGEYLIG